MNAGNDCLIILDVVGTIERMVPYEQDLSQLFVGLRENGFETIIVTSASDDEYALMLLDKTTLPNAQWPFIYTGGNVKNQESLHAIAKKHNKQIPNCILIDDSKENIGIAISAGLKTIKFRKLVTAADVAFQLESFDYMIKHYSGESPMHQRARADTTANKDAFLKEHAVPATEPYEFITNYGSPSEKIHRGKIADLLDIIRAISRGNDVRQIPARATGLTLD